MTLRVLIVGGYGHFGGHIARQLAGEPGVSLIIAGRSAQRASAFAATLSASSGAAGVALDIDRPLAPVFAEFRPDLVIHTTGPFQGQDYRVAEAAIAGGSHYCDLADARAFVCGVDRLDDAAQAAGVAVIAGASSVPCLTAAFIDRYRQAFRRLRRVDYGIGAAQATNRGLGTTAAVLSYVGKPFERLDGGRNRRVLGWQGTGVVDYPEIGRRLFGECDIPDLALFPARYPELETIRFRAGHELAVLHLGALAMSYAVRVGLVDGLSRHAAPLHRITRAFDRFGGGKSGFHMVLDGDGPDGRQRTVRIFMIARRAQGPNIPCVPATVIARRMARGWRPTPGARPCLDLIDLDEYLAALDEFDISTIVRGPGIRDSWGPLMEEVA